MVAKVVAALLGIVFIGQSGTLAYFLISDLWHRTPVSWSLVGFFAFHYFLCALTLALTKTLWKAGTGGLRQQVSEFPMATVTQMPGERVDIDGLPPISTLNKGEIQ